MGIRLPRELVGLFSLGAVVLTLGCADDDAVGPSGFTAAARSVAMLQEEFRFDPPVLVAVPGELISIQLTNHGTIEHSIRFDLPGNDRELDDELIPGEQGILNIVAPDEPGSYTYFCPVDDHREQGGVGVLEVRPDQSPRSSPTSMW